MKSPEPGLTTCSSCTKFANEYGEHISKGRQSTWQVDLWGKFMLEGKRHLEVALGTEKFKITYVNEKLEKWCKEIKSLSNPVKTQPYAR